MTMWLFMLILMWSPPPPPLEADFVHKIFEVLLSSLASESLYQSFSMSLVLEQLIHSVFAWLNPEVCPPTLQIQIDELTQDAQFHGSNLKKTSVLVSLSWLLLIKTDLENYVFWIGPCCVCHRNLEWAFENQPYTASPVVSAPCQILQHDWDHAISIDFFKHVGVNIIVPQGMPKDVDTICPTYKGLRS